MLLSYADEPVPSLFGGPITEVGTGFAVLLGTEPSKAAVGTLSLTEVDDGDGPPLAFQGTVDLASAFEGAGHHAGPTIARVGGLRPGHAINVVFSPTS